MSDKSNANKNLNMRPKGFGGMEVTKLKRYLGGNKLSQSWTKTISAPRETTGTGTKNRKIDPVNTKREEEIHSRKACWQSLNQTKQVIKNCKGRNGVKTRDVENRKRENKDVEETMEKLKARYWFRTEVCLCLRLEKNFSGTKIRQKHLTFKCFELKTKQILNRAMQVFYLCFS